MATAELKYNYINCELLHGVSFYCCFGVSCNCNGSWVSVACYVVIIWRFGVWEQRSVKLFVAFGAKDVPLNQQVRNNKTYHYLYLCESVVFYRQ
jgi:K+ transporter